MNVLNKFKLNSLTESTVEHYATTIGKIGITTSFIGAIIQYIDLLLIGSGSWILSYFSISYIIFEGINYIIYYIFFIFSINILGSYIGAVIFKEKKIYKLYLGMTLFLTAIILFFLCKRLGLLIYATPFVFLLYSFSLYLILYSFNTKDLTQRIKENRANQSSQDLDVPTEVDFFYLFIIAIISLNILNYISPKSIFSTPDDMFKNFPVLKQEFNDKDIIKKYYKNDTYIFIKYTDKDKNDKLIIKKIEDLLDNKEKATVIKPLTEL